MGHVAPHCHENALQGHLFGQGIPYPVPPPLHTVWARLERMSAYRTLDGRIKVPLPLIQRGRLSLSSVLDAVVQGAQRPDR